MFTCTGTRVYQLIRIIRTVRRNYLNMAVLKYILYMCVTANILCPDHVNMLVYFLRARHIMAEHKK